MTTVVVHGTFAVGKEWYWKSWGEKGFCWAVNEGIATTSGSSDLWRVNGDHVSHYSELRSSQLMPFPKWQQKSEEHALHNGVFYWKGGNMTNERADAGEQFARYLNVLSSLSNEPIRVIAHSHGCNVVKAASMHSVLSPAVKIQKAVFLACPHFWEQGANGMKYFRYRARPDRFGEILNIYSTQDAVQLFFSALAENIGIGSAPHFWDSDHPWAGPKNLPNAARLKGFERESADVHWVDLDPNTVGLYTDFSVEIEEGIVKQGKQRGIKPHSLLHGATVGIIAGAWLGANTSTDALNALHEAGVPDLQIEDTGYGEPI